MKKKRKKQQAAQPVREPTPKPEKLELAPEPEPEQKVIPISTGRVQVGDIVTRKPITFSDNDSKNAGWLQGRVVWVHPLGRFHVVEFGDGRRAIRESFWGVAR